MIQLRPGKPFCVPYIIGGRERLIWIQRNGLQINNDIVILDLPGLIPNDNIKSVNDVANVDSQTCFFKNFTLRCRVEGSGVEQALVRAVDASKRELEKKTIDVADRLRGAAEPEFGVRINGDNLRGAAYPVVVSVKAIGADGKTARVVVAIERPGG